MKKARIIGALVALFFLASSALGQSVNVEMAFRQNDEYNSKPHQISNEFDRFTGRTVIFLRGNQLSGGAFDGVNFGLRSEFEEGQDIRRFLFLLFQVSLKGEFYNGSGQVIFLADGKRIRFESPGNRLRNVIDKTYEITLETMVYRISFEDLESLSKAKKVECSFDGKVLQFKTNHLEGVQAFFSEIQNEVRNQESKKKN